MRSSPTGNLTLQRIQQEINEIAQRENELRNGVQNGVSNGDVSPPVTLTRAVSTSSLNSTPQMNGTLARRFTPNTKGVMQKFFKLRGKVAAVSTITNTTIKPPMIAWEPTEVTVPAKALIPGDKPLRKGYVPVEERIQKELYEMKSREEELRTLRRKSQPDLMAALDAEEELRSESPVLGKLRSSRSLVHLLDDDTPFETASAPPSLRPARSLAQLCDAPDEEIESPRTLIQQWEMRIKKSQDCAQL